MVLYGFGKVREALGEFGKVWEGVAHVRNCTCADWHMGGLAHVRTGMCADCYHYHYYVYLQPIT